MPVTPAVTVVAPEPRGIRYGLLTAAAGPLDLPVPHGRAGGVQYEPVSCGVAHLWPADCPDGETLKVFDDGDDVVQADPFVVYATMVCGGAGHTAAELEARVARRLANGEQGIAELALSNILDAAATPVVDVGDLSNIAAVVSGLEEWLYGTSGYGNVGMLHAPVSVAAYAASQGLMVADGPLKRTPFGTVWSIGGGYTGNIPGGTAASAHRVLVARFYEFPGGPPADLVGTPTVTVTALDGGAVPVGPTTTGVAHPATGVYTFVWDDPADPGDYLAEWSGTDVDSDTVTAGEVVTIGSAEVTPSGLYITGHVTVWRSADVHVFPAAQTFNRSTNQYRLVAEREYAVAYDCLAAGAAVVAEESS